MERGTLVRLCNVHHGSPDKGRNHYIYASLRTADTNELIISADIDYILSAVRMRGYVLVGDK